MAKNVIDRDLRTAQINKKDEFYTQFTDIEKELKYYKNHFKGKVVFCNCDDPFESNFFKYFALNFNHLKLKKLICTCYAGSTISGEQLSLFDVEPLKDTIDEEKKPYKVIINEVEDLNNDGAIDLVDIEALLKNKKNVLTLLDGSGDFRSVECIELLKQSDIVVTNPPFSLFREYVAQLVNYQKDFIIIGNVNAITYSDFFPLIKQDRVWMGASIHSGDREFRVPDSYPLKASGYRVDEKGNKYIRVKGVRWFTNLDYKERHSDLILYKVYFGNELDFPRYENFDAINVDLTKEIPVDYNGYIGVPITFLDKYNPDQFEIIGLGISNSGLEFGVQPYKEEHKRYRKEVQKRGAVDGDLYMIKNGIVEVTYARIIIKNKRL